MKQPWEWDEDDLQSLIDTPVQESISLDYKQCDALAKTDKKKNEVSKDVSAFANSAGGTIVYGIIEKEHLPERIDSGYDPADISREWLEQVINSRVQRRIDGVRITAVELTKSHPGRLAYVVNVPQSFRAPHQAADNKFYKRFNFESVPMEEYEVRDAARRLESPNLSLSFLVEITPKLEGDQAAPTVARITPIITNESPTPAEYTVVNIYIDNRLEIRGPGGMTEIGVATADIGGHQRVCKRLHINYSIPSKVPVFEGCFFRLLDNPIDVAIPAPSTYVIAWELHTPHMTKKDGGVLLAWNGQIVNLQGAEMAQQVS